MSDRLTTWFPLTLLAMLACLTFWLDQFVRPPVAGENSAARHDPDYIVEGLRAVRMDAAGSVKYSLIAERMVHYPDVEFMMERDDKGRKWMRRNGDVINE